MCKATQEVVWMRRFIGELLGATITAPTSLFCDNQASLAMIDNRVHHSRTKHISLRMNFIREQKLNNNLNPVYIDTNGKKNRLRS